LHALKDDKFESYLIKQRHEFIYPQVPDKVYEQHAGHAIDYDKLSTAIAQKMKGIIPSPSQIHIVNDQNGQRQFVIDANNRTEYKNKRQSIR